MFFQVDLIRQHIVIKLSFVAAFHTASFTFTGTCYIASCIIRFSFEVQPHLEYDMVLFNCGIPLNVSTGHADRTRTKEIIARIVHTQRSRGWRNHFSSSSKGASRVRLEDLECSSVTSADGQTEMFILRRLGCPRFLGNLPQAKGLKRELRAYFIRRIYHITGSITLA